MGGCRFWGFILAWGGYRANQPGGTNYAVGAALDAAVAANGFKTNLLPNPALPSVVQQISNYLAASGGAANTNGLYLLSSGGDVIYADTNIVGVPAQQSYLASRRTCGGRG